MAKNGKIKLNNAGFYAIRQEPKVRALLERKAEAIAKACNEASGLGDEGYKTSSQQGRKDPQGRWRTTVMTTTEATKIDNAENDTLLRNLDAGRD